MVDLLNTVGVFMRKGEFKPLNRPLGLSPRLFIKDTPKLELKDLSFHVQYDFLCDDNTLSLILFVGLSDVQLNGALAVLKIIKKVIGWKMSDI